MGEMLRGLCGSAKGEGLYIGVRGGLLAGVRCRNFWVEVWGTGLWWCSPGVTERPGGEK